MPRSSAALLALVTVVLKGGIEVPAKSVHSESRDLVLALEPAGERHVPLSEVSEIRFLGPVRKSRVSEETLRKLLTLLGKIRRNPFAGENLPPMPESPKERAEQARRLAERLRKEPSTYHRIQQSFSLAALRFGLDELEACRETLRRIKVLSRDSDPRLYDATCVRLSALQLKADGSEASTAWKDELLSDVLGPENGDRLKARIRAVEELARKAR